eukprot:CAMPEP_0205826828 /NCGR_PEP_ID=MMETSP0206-20130828/29986_1 /ASSEMBLY_ACC=CAM_ASM_000279 /TAXON_ID=36767 /ORGANISM="Euplotes focardii, Strain TN1" /LENGTH=159 /DNA_ID=CAMNT_0053127107 /DNA_START=320 /DNA_END=796 /DNA_ORIENTATION=-
MKESNEFFDVFKGYTSRIEASAGMRQFTEQPPTYDQSFLPPPPMEEQKHEKKRDSKFTDKLTEESKGEFPIIMKEELKTVLKPSIQLTPNLVLNAKPKDSGKKKSKQEIMMYVSKVSPEEKRAEMAKYKYDERNISKKLGSLKLSIEERMRAIKEKVGK